jgi:hypothetical protein
MEYFNRLAGRIDRAWRKLSYDDARFDRVAVAALDALPPYRHVEVGEILEWALGRPSLPQQLDPDSRFGQPPLTVYAGDRFHIDVLFWLDSTTSIHQHAFAGAFHVLAGSSIHSVFRFRERRRVSSELRIGDVAERRIAMLEPGGTRGIPAGRSFIHSLFHLDRPSVTVVVRSRQNPSREAQLTYLRPCVAFVRQPVPSASAARQLELVAMLHASAHPQRDRLTAKLLEGADVGLAFQILLAAHQHAGPAAFASLMKRARARFGTVADELAPALHEWRRQLVIIWRRHSVQDPNHRFLLALLLNVHRRDQILSLMRARHPRRDPTATVIAWAEELLGAPGSAESPLGLTLDQRRRDVLHALLEGGDDRAVLRRLRRRYGPAEVSRRRTSVLEDCAVLRRSSIFGPLFAPAAKRR